MLRRKGFERSNTSQAAFFVVFAARQLANPEHIRLSCSRGHRRTAGRKTQGVRKRKGNARGQNARGQSSNAEFMTAFNSAKGHSEAA
jgi:hypothetical protein